jgi:hypothetical protein
MLMDSALSLARYWGFQMTTRGSARGEVVDIPPPIYLQTVPVPGKDNAESIYI